MAGYMPAIFLSFSLGLGTCSRAGNRFLLAVTANETRRNAIHVTNIHTSLDFPLTGSFLASF